MFKAVIDTKEEMQHEAGTIVPIGALEEIRRGEVTVEGRVLELWVPSSQSIQQVGLLEDETGRTKFTIWAKSNQTMVRKGERVRFRAAAKELVQWAVFDRADPLVGNQLPRARSVVGVAERVLFLLGPDRPLPTLPTHLHVLVTSAYGRFASNFRIIPSQNRASV